ncbi:E3 ubiquitin-protein ligase RAD18 isoform X1 [Silurus meridionalis]|uniref:E3 ubiquitin-protein ligase RAD18 isoform X1 n=1 Tax=Silurus meridionalis TaxID=175797 RepID=UPI001EEB9CA2|nr:E3 ubiquitin-protein ligase RAD18 isoform X1 [Silurus meridionalis]
MSHSVEADLPPNLSCLKNFDTLLRCPICFDFLNISMMTQCSHNFCSLCIRKFLSYKLLCPVCNTPLTEQELRNNRLLDDLVQSFQAVRQQLSQANFESPPISPKTPTTAVGGKAARQKALKKESATLTRFFQKRAPVNSSTGALSGSKGLHPVKQEPMEVCVQEALLPDSAMTVTTAVKEEKLDVPVFPSTSQDIKPVVKVECPVCGVGVSQQHINKHLDTCLARGEKKDSLRRSDQLGFSCSAFIEPNCRKRRPMAKLVYNLLTMGELKRRLRECHLSTQGSRDQLIRRHQEFTHIYNAQCDALNPRLSEDIAKEVENNEKTRNQLKSESKPVILINKNHKVEEIEQLHSDYRKQHSSEFSRLIAQVRGRLENSRRTQIKQEGGKSSEASCCSAEDTVVSSTTQPPASSTLDVGNYENTVIEVGSRSPSPTLSEVSVSRKCRGRESGTEKRKI